jgi:starch phosphorylase
MTDMGKDDREDGDDDVARGMMALRSLALDLRTSWNHVADLLWNQLDPEQWELTRNPWGLLQTLSRKRIAGFLKDRSFRESLESVMRSRSEYVEKSVWFTQAYPTFDLSCVAYFSMEYMLSESLPIYAGGLGNVAGDQLKAASDLGVPVVGVGLLYQQGYFRQMIDHQGEQRALQPFNDPSQLPIQPVTGSEGERLRLEIQLPGYSVWLRAWQVQVGRARLYLLDSNDPANLPLHRTITNELYGGGPEHRIKQEMLLGMGGWNLLRKLGLDPEIAHLNEGHAAFVVLERARSFIQVSGLPFESALVATRAGNLFTTHTAVAAGFDRFEPQLVERYLGNYCREQLGIPLERLLQLGRKNPHDVSEPLSMAYLAARGSGSVNGVSRLHGSVSRQLFADLFPRWPISEVPVGHVTNGVHMPSWDSAEADSLWTDCCGKDRWSAPAARKIQELSQATIWKFRNESRRTFIDYVRGRLSRQLAAAGSPAEDIAAAGHVLDPDTLTIVFARRFVPYKRPNLLLQDPQRLIRLLTNPEAPIQIVIAGKAPPYDDEGRRLIRQWHDFISLPEVRRHVVFLADYDMRLSSHMVQGADVWLNTPLAPWEACGTSGMKALVNGGLNLSVLDGWWEEAYSPESGWCFGENAVGPDRAGDGEALYETLEKKVIPEFYQRDEEGIPSQWVKRLTNSMTNLTNRYSADRTVRQYTDLHYIPMARRYRMRSAGAKAAETASYLENLGKKWPSVRFGTARQHTAQGLHWFEVQVDLGEIGLKWVQVQLYADPSSDQAEVSMEMERMDVDGLAGWHTFRASVPADRPASDFTPRVIPRREGLLVPLEAGWITWQR